MVAFLALLITPALAWVLAKFLLGLSIIPLIYQNISILFAIVGIALAIVLIKKLK